MRLNKKTLEKLRDLINEETEYRSGRELVSFFNELGFNDTYGSGFPSRWVYTDEKLEKINGTPEIDKCIKNLYNPIGYIGDFENLDEYIKDFNQYLAFDGWKVIRRGKNITITKADEEDLEAILSQNPIKNEQEFLSREFDELSLDKIGLEGVIADVLKSRLDEIQRCILSSAPLATIFLCGSTLEGILLGIAQKYPQKFNQAKSAPKNAEKKVKQFHEWKLNDLINVAYELDFLKEDVKEYSHVLKDFRNYIHPYMQVKSNFYPDEQTVKISWQVLKAAICQISQK